MPRPQKLSNSPRDGDFYLATSGDTHLAVDMRSIQVMIAYFFVGIALL
jgi:hypothetical protein